jgi:hypothetical protein
MSYEKMTDLSTDNVTALGGVNSKTGEKNPLKVEGFYLGARNVQTTNGPSVIHVFQTAEGNQGIWGTKKLNDNLTKSALGKMVLVKYAGKIKIAGGKTQHTYEFFIDKSQAIDVSAASEGIEDFGGDADDGGYTNGEDTETPIVTLSAAQKDARAKELLRNAKSSSLKK